MAIADGLERLLQPSSIAVVGATDRADSYGDTLLRNLERLGFEGEVWGVNPSRERIREVPCVPALADLPGPVDAVAVAIPAAGVPAVIAEAATLGCGGAVVVSAGFGEVESGRGLERELREAALAGALPVCGPNGNGVVSFHARAALWGDSVQALRPGRVAMVSQSGNVAVNALGSRRGIRFHTVVSTGNQAVCDASDWLGALSRSDGVGSVALFLESDGDGERLAAALADCAERRIGVAVLKVGSSEAGAGAAAAHTGSLAGDQRVFRSLIEEAGGRWASDPHELLELARVLAEPRARPRSAAAADGGATGSAGASGLAILTCSGGDSGTAADRAEELGIELPALAEPTAERLRELLPEAATIANPLDYTSMIWAQRERLASIVETVGADPAIDQLLIYHDTPEELSPEVEPGWRETRGGLADGAERAAAAPLFASTLPDLIGEDEIAELSARGIAAVQGLTTAVRCVAALRDGDGNPSRLREISAAAGARGPGGAGPWRGEAETKRILAAYGVPVPELELAGDPAAAAAAAQRLGFPVALKLSSAAFQHKSDLGAIELGLADPADVREAAARILALAEAEGAELIVERMADPGPELVVAVRGDAVVPALVIGLGGIWTELLDDVAVIPLPAPRQRIEAALLGLRGAGLLTGARGSEPVDLAAVAAAAAAIGAAALAEDLVLLEVNPLIAGPAGCVAVDALARRRAATGADA